jgi:hypothetical protein
MGKILHWKFENEKLVNDQWWDKMIQLTDHRAFPIVCESSLENTHLDNEQQTQVWDRTDWFMFNWIRIINLYVDIQEDRHASIDDYSIPLVEIERIVQW